MEQDNIVVDDLNPTLPSENNSNEATNVEVPAEETITQPTNQETEQEPDSDLGFIAPEIVVRGEPVKEEPSIPQQKDGYYVDIGNGIVVRFETEPSDEAIFRTQEKYHNAGLLKPAAGEQEEFSREYLRNNKVFKQAFRDIYELEKGKPFKGTDDELVSSFYSDMRFLQFNTPAMLQRWARLQGGYYNEKQLQDLRLLDEVYDKAVPFWKNSGQRYGDAVKNYVEAFRDIGVSLALDPLTYAGGAAAGSAIYKVVSGIPVAAIKGANKLFLSRFVGAAVGATTSFTEGFGQSLLHQDTERMLGERFEPVSGVEAAQEGVLSGVFGGGAGWLAGTATESAFKRFKDYYVNGVGLLDTPAKKAAARVGEQIIADRNTLLSSYNELSKAIAKNATNTGELRKRTRELAIAHYRETLSQFGTKGRLMNRYKMPEDAAVGISQALDPEAIEHTFTALKIKPGSSYNDIVDRLLKDDARTVVEKAARTYKGVKFAGSEQYPALIMALQDALFTEGRRLSTLPDAQTDDITALLKRFLRVSSKKEALRTESGRIQQYWKTDTLLTNAEGLKFTVDDFINLAPEEQIKISEMAFSLSDMRKSENFLNDIANHVLGQASSKYVKGVERFKSYYISNILGGIRTPIDNFIFSGFRFSQLITERFLGSIALLNATERKAAFAEIRSLMTDSMMYKETIRLATDAFLTSKAQLDPRHMAEDVGEHFVKHIDVGKAIKGEANFRLFPDKDGEDFGAMRLLGNLFDLLGNRSMVTVDEIWANVAFRARVTSKAYVDLLEQGVDSKKAWEQAKEMSIKAVEEQMHLTALGQESKNPLVIAGMMESAETRFATPVQKGGDIGQIGRWIHNMAHPVYKDSSGPLVNALKATSSIPATMIAPIIRNPIAMVNHVFETTPFLASLSKRFRTDMASGDPEKVGAAIGKLLLGTMLWADGLDRVITSDVPGSGPQDPRQQELLKGGTGGKIRQPAYNVKGYDVNRVQPGNKYEEIIADIRDIYKYGDNTDWTDTTVVLALTLANQLTDIPGAQGVSRLVRLAQDWANPTMEGEEKIERTGAAAATYASSAIPMARLLALLYDDETTAMETQTALQVIKNRIPVLRKPLTEAFGGINDPKRDIVFGASLVKDPRVFHSELLPIAKYNMNDDYVNTELVRVFTIPGRNIMDETKLTRIGKTLDGVDLSEHIYNTKTNESYYSRLQELVGTVESKIPFDPYKGKTLYEALVLLMHSDKYKEAAMIATTGIDEATEEALKRKSPQAKMINEVIGHYRQLAKVKLMEEMDEKAEKGDKTASVILQSIENQRKWKDKDAEQGAFFDFVTQ